MKILKENVSKQEVKEFLYYGMSIEDKHLYQQVNESQANIFQFSGGTASGMIQRAIPTNFEELTCLSALSRPGSSFEFDDFVNNGTTSSKYPKIIAEKLEDSHGCILFQEQIMKLVEDLSNGKVNGNYCFAGNTKVLTEDGEKTIKQIVEEKKPIKVWSYNKEEEKYELKEVINFFDNGEKNTMKLILENEREIICTPEHLFLTKNRGWVKAIDLEEDDDLLDFPN